MSRGAGPLRLRHRVLAAVAAHGMWGGDARVVVACSGGRDSTVLLDVLAATRAAHGAQLEVLTVDHGTRDGSAADAAFVERLAEERGLRCTSVRLHGVGNSEAALRHARHQVFARLGEEGAVVALGHHRRDQAETLLLQVLRGGGAAGRRGMLPVRGHLARPLLHEPTEALAAWADHRGLGWRTDPSNMEDGPLRNRLRRLGLPLLEQLRPGAEACLARSAQHAAEDEALLSALAKAQPLGLEDLCDAPPALVRRALRQRWPSLSATQVDAVLRCARRGGGVVPLGPETSLFVSTEGVVHRGVGEGGLGVT